MDRIEPATNRVQRVIPLGNDLALGIACLDDELWVTGWNDRVIYHQRVS